MSDERDRLLEEAIAKIEPKNDAERAKLERLREVIRASSADMAGILARHREEQAERKAEHEEAQKRMRDQTAVNEANREALLAGLEKQAGLIERIARATAKAG